MREDTRALGGEAMRLDGKVAIVTGGSRGIGREIALTLADRGCRVALCARGDVVKSTADELGAHGAEAFAAQVDVGDPAAFREFVVEVTRRLGPVGILVNNAGINRSGSVLEAKPEDVDAMLRTNVSGVLFCAQAVVPGMIERRWGRIINIGSVVARTPVPLFSAYSASKAAAISLTRGLALELAPHNITVNAVCPGNVWTDIWTSSTADFTKETGKDARAFYAERIACEPLGRGEDGWEIAALTAYLCGEAARNITGESLFVSGGL